MTYMSYDYQHQAASPVAMLLPQDSLAVAAAASTCCAALAAASISAATQPAHLDAECSASSRRRRRPRQSVSFSDTSRVTILPSRTPDEDAARWYSRNDLCSMKEATRSTAKALRPTRTAKLMKRVACLAAANAARSEAEASQGSEQGEAGHHAMEITDDPVLRSLHLQGRLEGIRGMEHLLCPAVATLLMRQRRAVMAKVLEEQVKEDSDDADGLPRAWRIARASMRESAFAKEWMLGVTCLQAEP